jgi:TatD DNase family protein
MNNYALFDLHSHLHDTSFDEDRESIIEQMKSYGVGTITIGTDLKESKKALALSEKHEHIYASTGLHPADNVTEEFAYNEFKKVAISPRVVAIGECGLDYFYLEKFFEKDKAKHKITRTKEEEKDRQKHIFKEQIRLAVDLRKPLMLHGRPSTGSMDAYEDMLTILEEEKKKHGERLKGNAHFFVGNIEIAKRFIDIGFTMSFSGVITFTKDYDDVVRFLPSTMILAETDSPYATPAPFRGERNDPLKVQEIVARVAVLRSESMEVMRVQVLENVKRVFEVA